MGMPLVPARAAQRLAEQCAPGLVKLIKTGARVVRHARYVTFQLAGVAVPHKVFAAVLAQMRRFAAISPKPAPI